MVTFNQFTARIHNLLELSQDKFDEELVGAFTADQLENLGDDLFRANEFADDLSEVDALIARVKQSLNLGKEADAKEAHAHLKAHRVSQHSAQLIPILAKLEYVRSTFSDIIPSDLEQNSAFHSHVEVDNIAQLLKEAHKKRDKVGNGLLPFVICPDTYTGRYRFAYVSENHVYQNILKKDMKTDEWTIFKMIDDIDIEEIQSFKKLELLLASIVPSFKYHAVTK